MDDNILEWAQRQALLTREKFEDKELSDVTIADMQQIPFGVRTEIASGVYATIYYRTDTRYDLICDMEDSELEPHFHSNIAEMFEILEGEIHDSHPENNWTLKEGDKFTYNKNIVHHMVVSGRCVMRITGTLC